MQCVIPAASPALIDARPLPPILAAPVRGTCMQLRWPSSRDAIASLQSARKRRAVELAMRAPFFRDRLKGIDLDRLDHPDVWCKIPLLTKDQLRQIPIEQFHH